MLSNSELIQKADLVLANVANGTLSPAQSARFVRKVIDAPTMIRVARAVEMRAPTQEINKIGFGSRILKAATENTGLDDTAGKERSKPTFEKVTLNTNEVIAEVRIPYAVMEDVIERANIGSSTDVGGTASGGGVVDTIVDLIAERTALDLEELALLGDTGSGDAYLALQDGWIKQMTSHVVDHASAPISKDVFKDTLQAMPTKYLRNLTSMRHYVAHHQQIEYRNQLADRATGLGDNMITGRSPVFAHGVEVLAAALMPTAKGIFCDPMNLIFGIWRNVHMEFDKDIKARQYIIVVTARVDFKIEEEDATVLAINIGG